MLVNDKSCSACGCTDRFGCPEGCHWVEGTTIDLCSVCAGITRRRSRSFTLTAKAALRPDVPDGMLGIFNRVGRLVGLAWAISEAQAMASGIDANYREIRRRADAAHAERASAPARRDWVRAQIPAIVLKGQSHG